MEKLKEPAMLLSVANSIALVGTTAYFYKQLEAIRLDMIKMSQTLTGVVRKISEMEKGEQRKGEALHTLNDQVKRINQQIDDLPSFDNFDNIDLDIDEIIAILEENNITIERPSKIQRIRRSGDRRNPRREEIEDKREISAKRSSVRSSERSRDLDSRQQSRDQDSRQQSRDQDSRQQYRQNPRQVNTKSDTRSDINNDSHMEYEEDADLIGEIRRKQTC